ncbi:hypothetical protein [Sulfitobacter sp. 1A12779]|uniref:hypothetical protein n=1 Tax=Sulfitobacter sp. 1A12779 TaxID=3368599 RepID=UPI00374651BF
MNERSKWGVPAPPTTALLAAAAILSNWRQEDRYLISFSALAFRQHGAATCVALPPFVVFRFLNMMPNQFELGG